MNKRIGFAIASVLFSATASAQVMPFFSGFINACQQPPEFEKFEQNLCIESSHPQTGINICKQGRVILPANMKDHVKSAKMKNEGYNLITTVTLKYPIMFGFNDIVAFENEQGQGTFRSSLVTNETSVKKVQKQLDAEGIVLKSVPHPVFDKMQAVIQKGDDGKVRITCDRSN